MAALILAGANINVFLNNKIYKVAQTVTLDVDYSEEGIFGIDTPWAQEIAGGRVMVKGAVKGLRVKNSGGLQASNLRPLYTDLAASPYISIRIQDRASGEDLYFIPKAKVSVESHDGSIKSIYRLNFTFTGQMILFALDRS